MGNDADVLIDMQWVEQHLEDPTVRVVEVDEDVGLYSRGHIPGAIGLDWRRDLQARASCDFLGPERFGELLGAHGISNEHRIVLYGDRDNWFAATTFWYLKYYGHDDVWLLEHDRDGWIAAGKPLSAEPPAYDPQRFTARPGDADFSAAYDDGSHSGWGSFGDAVLDPAEV
ncbi:sulfurtransferase [Conexibacter sp. CPCC 206217]|uniref:sulfurtransferase n=1 Tax=Conexibacter sp. CPCC 206217 TaxID=3064574 RepID=UPI002725A032|nr:rhodanese-like domain-containing protein [Conexibacter sp. CPCC 206217]MDO8212335.1 rhodanese-like domain-containing protein [Conexibacter sp. CPCC 206217]